MMDDGGGGGDDDHDDDEHSRKSINLNSYFIGFYISISSVNSIQTSNFFKNGKNSPTLHGYSVPTLILVSTLIHRFLRPKSAYA